MDKINDYVYSILIISLVCGVINIFAPDGKLKKYIKYTVSLAVVLTLLLPFRNIIYTIPKQLMDNMKAIENSVSDTYDGLEAGEAYTKQTVEFLKKEIISSVKSRFNKIISVDIIVDASDYSNIIIRSIDITSGGNAVIQNHIKKMFNAEVKVTLNGD